MVKNYPGHSPQQSLPHAYHLLIYSLCPASLLTTRNDNSFSLKQGSYLYKVLEIHKRLAFKSVLSRTELSPSKCLPDLRLQGTELTSTQFTKSACKYCEVTFSGECSEDSCYLQVFN